MKTSNHYPKATACMNADIEEAVPELLKEMPCIAWKAGSLKPNGKFDKLPIGRDGTGNNWTKPEQQMSFEKALDVCRDGKADGIGIVLPGKSANGLHLVIIDIDGIDPEGPSTPRLQEIEALHGRLGQPYAEISPSGHGIRMAVLSEAPVDHVSSCPNPLGGADEVFCSSPKFATLTGNYLVGADVPIATEQIRLYVKHLQERQAQQSGHTSRNTRRKRRFRTRIETPREVACIQQLLSNINPDCDYTTWRNVVWALLSLQWSCSEDLALEWSMGAPHRFSHAGFRTLVRSYCPSYSGPTVGTLEHLARQGGHNGTR